jgi:hypothetical protein
MQKNTLRIAVIVIIILFIPLFGNFFVEGWNWGVLDFVSMGILLFITGLAIDFTIRKFNNNPLYQSLSVIVIIGILLLLWVEMAVGAVSRSLNMLLN